MYYIVQTSRGYTVYNIIYMHVEIFGNFYSFPIQYKVKYVRKSYRLPPG